MKKTLMLGLFLLMTSTTAEAAGPAFASLEDTARLSEEGRGDQAFDGNTRESTWSPDWPGVAYKGCSGFASCLGGALVSAPLVPIASAIEGASIGADTEVDNESSAPIKAGVKFIGGSLGTVFGLAVGAVLAPISVVVGIGTALLKLFSGDWI